MLAAYVVKDPAKWEKYLQYVTYAKTAVSFQDDNPLLKNLHRPLTCVADLAVLPLD